MSIEVEGQTATSPLTKDSQYCVFLFPSVSYVLKAEKILKDREIDHKLIPVPRQISADCGVCLRIAVDQQESVVKMLQGTADWESMVLL